MSQSTTPQTTNAAITQASGAEPIWAKPAVSIYALTIFLIAFGIAYMAKDSASLTMMMGAAISMGTSVVNYYLGSSSGSAQKTALMAPQPGTVTTTTTPIVPAPAAPAP